MPAKSEGPGCISPAPSRTFAARDYANESSVIAAALLDKIRESRAVEARTRPGTGDEESRSCKSRWRVAERARAFATLTRWEPAIRKRTGRCFHETSDSVIISIMLHPWRLLPPGSWKLEPDVKGAP